MPTRRMVQLAAAFNIRTSGPTTELNKTIGGASSRALARGRAIATFFGASSPKTICAMVASPSARPARDGHDGAGVRPRNPPQQRRSTGVSAVSTTKPKTSELAVMPSCTPES